MFSARTFTCPLRLSSHSRQQCRSQHAAHALKARQSPQPLKHLSRKTTKPGERQLNRDQKTAARGARAAAFSQPPQPIMAPTVQETTPTEEYFVRRTPTRNLPIYQLAKRGGNLKVTRIRKVEGERGSLVDQLKKHLDPQPEWIRVNSLSGLIHMKVSVELSAQRACWRC